MTGSFFAFFAASFPLLSLVPGFFEKEVQASLKPGLPRQSEPQHGKEKGSWLQLRLFKSGAWFPEDASPFTPLPAEAPLPSHLLAPEQISC